MAKTLKLKAQRGRPSIFRDKEDGVRVQAVISKASGRLFEASRKRLAELAGREIEHTSQADVIEFLLRGEKATKDYLKGK